jgi:hypothetical protein
MIELDYFDDIVYDARFMPWQGWYGDFTEGPKGPIIGYAIQQDKNEFVRFADVLISKFHLGGKMLQLGLGCPGASHLCWKKIFDQVVSLEISGGHIDALLSRFGDCPTIILGNTSDPVTFDKVAKYAPFDCLFIDADHRYEAVKSDYNKYYSLVKNGGVVGFNDTIEHPQYGPENQAWKFVNELSQVRSVFRIGTNLGISWMTRE